MKTLLIIDALSEMKITQEKLHVVANVLGNEHFSNANPEENFAFYVYFYESHGLLFEVIIDYIVELRDQIQVLSDSVDEMWEEERRQETLKGDDHSE